MVVHGRTCCDMKKPRRSGANSLFTLVLLVGLLTAALLTALTRLLSLLVRLLTAALLAGLILLVLVLIAHLSILFEHRPSYPSYVAIYSENNTRGTALIS